MKKVLDTEKFKEKAIEVQGNKYNYDLAVYINMNTSIDIICPVHGLFKQRPWDHLDGCGCPKCYSDNFLT